MKARLQLTVTTRDGTVVDERRACNTVLRGGAQLFADLFAGTGSPITHMGVGTNDAVPDDVEVTALTNDVNGDDLPLAGETLGTIPPDAFVATVVPERRVVQLRIRGTMPPDAAIGRVREAGLVSQSDGGTVLYNRVVFAPVDKRGDHDLTLFWEIEFPYGDLQWLN